MLHGDNPMTRDKQYFREASKRSRARKAKKIALLENPLLTKAVAIVTLVETRGWTVEQAVKHILLSQQDSLPTPITRL
jgi:hypothetical protein